MRSIEIEEVAVEQSGHVMVTPRFSAEDGLEFIYRAGRGVRWDPSRRALLAVGADGSPVEAFARIVAAVEEEYGLHLQVGRDTKWTDVSEELRQAFVARGSVASRS